MRTTRDIVRRVSNINLTLRQKKFSIDDINDFWDRLFENAPKIDKVGIDNIKVCTGCGTLNIEKIEPPRLACCPDNNYIKINQHKTF
ncbi:hypothetical protein [Tenacibaculum haliotis]|uniref:hypothetical protein n=1 Tax=Tenacibaculum haliotis TaxID=1888914 RepID=UPI0021AEED68|nr:hypothetical protein [Tenacibaculum haliotis]MCT4698475.1 hypothetical protein [Tenacibaculum haliotis]